jgi:putative flippase GtrA
MNAGRAVRPWSRPLGFALVGCVGFAADALVFLLLSQGLGLGVLVSRIGAFLPATLATWSLNRRWVFDSRGRGRRRDEYLRHLAVQSLGIGVNFACFYGAVRWGLGRGSAQLVPLALGSLAGMGFNYLGASRYVFRS